MTRDVGHMSEAVFRKVAKEITEFQEAIALHHFGDPVLHPEFARYLEIADNEGLDTFFSTPGSALTAEKAEQILDANPHFVTISMDGISKGSHEAMRVGSDYETTKRRVERFIRRRDERGREYPIVQMQFIETAYNEGELEEFRGYWTDFFTNPTDEEYSDEVFVQPFHDWGVLDEEVLNRMAGEDQGHLMKHDHEGETPCWGLWNELVVLWNGDVVPCCFDHDGDLVLGNVRDETLEAIFHGERARELRQRHLDGDFPERCEGCPGIMPPSNDQDPFRELDGEYT
jgi:radical SAM protein with 4Fe4S-binding SPASM domain